jgi:pimeloyl-ACP methyl ester carboxylesterase
MMKRVFLLACAAAAAAALVVASAYNADLRQEAARVSTGSKVVATPCGPIEYAQAGSGPVVLVVHGAGGGFDQGMALGNELAARGFQVIAPSRFGYLRTPFPADASPAAQADAHACLLDALGLGRVAVIGVSAGAPSTMQFALRHSARIAAMVLLVPLAYAPPSERAAAPELSAPARFLLEAGLKSDFLFWSAVTLAPAVVTRTVLATPPELVAKADAREQARAGELMRRILPVSRRQAGLLHDATLGASLGRDPIERITAPTLVVSLQDDLFGTFDSARYSAQHIPGARFVSYPTGGHVWVGRHEQVMAEIVRFLGPQAPLAGLAR